jgi:hypothetical protein
MALFTHKLSGEVVDRPAHYANHPVLGKNLILLTEEAKAPEEKKKRGFAKKTADYIPFATDGDGDGLVQDGTEWERPVGVEIPQEPEEAPEDNIDNNEENN